MRIMLICLGLTVMGCASPPPKTPYWYRIYEIDPQTNEQISKTYTCHFDKDGNTKCWEEAR